MPNFLSGKKSENLVFANFLKTTLFWDLDLVGETFGTGLLIIVFLISGLLGIFTFFGVFYLDFALFLSLGVTGDLTLLVYGFGEKGRGLTPLGDTTLSFLGFGETDFLEVKGRGEARALNFLMLGTYPLGVEIWPEFFEDTTFLMFWEVSVLSKIGSSGALKSGPSSSET